jgi:hypothetical protein
MDNEIAEIRAKLVAEQLYCWLCDVTGNDVTRSKIRIALLILQLKLTYQENKLFK